MEKTIGDKTFNIRPLKRGEMKKLRAEGFNMTSLSVEKADEAVDKVLGLVLPDRIEELDDLDNPEVLDLFKAVISLTYGGPDVKNS